MKKYFLFLLIVVTSFSCEKVVHLEEDLNITSDPTSIIMHQSTLGHKKDTSSFSFENVVQQGTPCEDIDVGFYLHAEYENCCVWNVEINYIDFIDGHPRDLDYQVYIDGLLLGGAAALPQRTFSVIVCDDDPVLVQIYSEGELCFAKLFDCKTSDCCSQLTYNESCWEDGDCTIYEFTVNDPTGCWTENGTMAFNFNDALGVPQFQALSNGFRVRLCNPEQCLRFIVWDEMPGDPNQTLCYISSFRKLGDCVD